MLFPEQLDKSLTVLALFLSLKFRDRRSIGIMGYRLSEIGCLTFIIPIFMIVLGHSKIEP